MKIITVEKIVLEIGDAVTINHSFIHEPHAGMIGRIADIDLDENYIVSLTFEGDTRYRIFNEDQLTYKEES